MKFRVRVTNADHTGGQGPVVVEAEEEQSGVWSDRVVYRERGGSMATLIGLGGKLRAGKDAVADVLEEEFGFQKVGMSDPLNDALLRLNPLVLTDFPVRIGYRRTAQWEPVRYRELHDAVGYVEAKRHQEVRRLLQVLGTEVGRHMISEDVWVDIMETRIREMLAAGQNVAITAMRFPNELEMLQRLGGTSVWVERPSLNEMTTPAVVGHASEHSVSREMFEYTILNDGSLEQLRQSARDFMRTVEKRKTVGTIPIFPPYDA